MIHTIIGYGNLGIDLHHKLRQSEPEENIYIRSQSRGWFYPRHGVDCIPEHSDYIWCCVGSGSIAQSEQDFERQIDLHLRLPAELLKLKKPKLIFFSTNYVADESEVSNNNISCTTPKSLYAYSKLWMEQMIQFKERPNTAIVRVESLYGNHKPCFPSRIRLSHKKGKMLRAASNYVCPTPTWWLADMLVDNLDKLFNGAPVHHVGPLGCCSVMQWMKKILGENINIAPEFFVDEKRPFHAGLECSLDVYLDYKENHWETLWDSDRNKLKLR